MAQTMSAASTQQHNSDINKLIEDTDEDPLKGIDPNLFQILQDIDLDRISAKHITLVLPFVVKLLLNPYFSRRKRALELVFDSKEANDVIASLLTKNIETQDLNLAAQTNLDPNLFESSSAYDRIKLVASEYVRIQDIARQANLNTNPPVKLQDSSLFDNPLFVDDIIIHLFSLLNKPTTIPVMNILDVSEALLHIKNGPYMIVRLVLNMPESCREVCHSLINFGENQDECEKINKISDQRSKTVRALCRLNPHIAFTVRSLTLQLAKMPSLTIMITLDRLLESLEKYSSVTDSQETQISSDEESFIQSMVELEEAFDNSIAFITGILLGVDESVKSWFAQYLKSAQQKRIDQSHHTILATFRSTLLYCVKKLFSCFLDMEFVDEKSVEPYRIDKTEEPGKFLNRRLIQVTATLRFYCALRGIGMLKLNHDESETLLRLVTCKQTANQTSINLATNGVCTLLVCSSMINNQKDEKRAAEWLKWLIKDSRYSDSSLATHGKCSISELLLLVAIHFQNNQTNQIAELVHATLGLRLQTKASVSKCKSLFVQEVFTDQMIAEHAVRVPVTKGLDNSIKEFLPIHCIHQLLECRSFSKHQVPIEDWILRQICESKKPIHHMLPDLICAYVNSIIVSTSTHGHCGTNKPISESDILKVFNVKLYSLEMDRAKPTADTENKAHASRRRRKRREKLAEEQEVIATSDTEGGTAAAISNDGAADLTILDVEVSQVLLLYYMMLYEDMGSRKSSDSSTADRAKLTRYTSDFMMDIPVFYLLQLVRDNQDQFGVILPPLLRLVATQYPHLCSIQHWLNTTDHHERYKTVDVSCSILSVEGSSSPKVVITAIDKLHSNNSSSCNTYDSSFKHEMLAQLSLDFKNLDKGELTPLLKTINTISLMQRNDIWAYVDVFIENWTKVLHMERHNNQSEYTELIESITKLWWKFNTICPRKLWVMTINSLRTMKNGSKLGSIQFLVYSWGDLVNDPLIALRCDNLVFRCPQYLNILLHILSAFLAASRRCLHEQLADQPVRQKDNGRGGNPEELKTTLVLAQASAAIQILLEFCLPLEDELEVLDKRDSEIELSQEEQFILDRFDSSVSCVCHHLHQVFIADTNLAKLVHFQTYPSELLATTCDKIPSMHICLDFIPELLSQPDLSKQVFVIELVSHLCEKYAITKSLNVAKLCFNVAYTLLQLLPSDKRVQFYLPTLPALLRICKLFPILQEDTRIILNQINQITLAHIASTSSRLSLGSAKPFEGLEKVTWIEVRKLMNSLSPDEALYLCIQKCLLDLDCTVPRN